MAESFVQTVRAEVRALDPSPRALRSFGLTVGGVLALIAALLLWRRGPSAWTWGVGGVGAALLLLGVVAPVALRGVRQAWMALAFAMGFVMTRVILTLAFAVLFVPTGLVLRLLGKDLLRRRLDPGAETYWIPKEDGVATRESLERFF